MSGWAYVGAHLSTGSGPTGSLQFLGPDDFLTGSNRLVFLTSSGDPTGSATVTGHHTLKLTGTLDVSGSVFAHGMYVTNLTHKHVTVFSSSGASKFGDSADDLHQFTGTISIGGGPVVGASPVISASGKIGAGYFSSSGDLGSTLGGETLFSSPNSSIKASGSISASVNISASGLVFGQSVSVDPGGSVFFRGTGGNSKIGCQGSTNLIIRADANIVLNNDTSGTAKIAARHFSSSGDLGSTLGGETLFSSPHSSIKASGSITGSNIVATDAVSGAGTATIGGNISSIYGVVSSSGIATARGLLVDPGDSVYFKGTGDNTKIGAHGGNNLNLQANDTIVFHQKASGSTSLAARLFSSSGDLGSTFGGETIFSSPNSSIKASGSISASVDLSASGKVLGAALHLPKFQVLPTGLPSASFIGDFIVHGLRASGNVQLGNNVPGGTITIGGGGEETVFFNAPAVYSTPIYYQATRPTGTINAAQTGFVQLDDMYLVCSGGGVVTLELPRLGTAGQDAPSGSTLFIKRSNSGQFGPMTFDVKVTATYPGDDIEGYGEVFLETAGASIMLHGSGTTWHIF